MHSREISPHEVLARFYPHIVLGPKRSPLRAIAEGIGFGHHDSIGSLRKESARTEIHPGTHLGRVFLLRHLNEDITWASPSVSAFLGGIIDEMNEEVGTQRMYGMKKCDPLIMNLAKRNDVTDQDMRNIIKGLRIDGAYIALHNNEAKCVLVDVLHTYAKDYLDPERAKHIVNSGLVEKISHSEDIRELYWLFYSEGKEEGRGGFRRIGSLPPYEVVYWKWLNDNGYLTKEKHLPFTDIIINYYGGIYPDREYVKSKVKSETGIAVQTNAIEMRYCLLQEDFPDSAFANPNPTGNILMNS